MKAVKLVMVALVLFVGAGILSADIVLTPIDDAYIRDGDYADTNYNIGTLLLKNDVPSFNRKVYIKFDISSLSQPAAAAELALTIGWVSPAESEVHELIFWGLDDSLDGSWTEETITWNNAPANVLDSGMDFDPNYATVLGSISFPGLGVLQEGDVITFSSQALVDFINSDTNGFITIMISRVEQGNICGPFFTSKEHTVYSGPRLTITPIPEPASIGLLLLGLGLLRRR